ncbi:hypothetical protein CR513_11763, partial [Mucuna pruriens]
MLSAPDLRSPKHALRFSSLSLTPTSPSLSNSPLSSSMATLDRRNSCNNIPPCAPPMCPISAATLCCSLAVDIMNADPRNRQPS